MLLALHTLAIAVLSSGGAPASQAAPPDLRAWFEMTPPQFGCYLEKTFGYRDPRFNCSVTAYAPKLNPCTDGEAYYEGPAFPESLAQKLGPGVQRVSLEWEHGDLRSVTLVVGGRPKEAELRQRFRLPPAGKERDAKLMSVRSEATGSATALTIEAFEHMGTGDVECGDGAE